MPHSTYAYPFEGMVLAFAGGLSAQLAGGEADSSFIMLFDDKGSVRSLHFECREESWHKLIEKLEQAGVPYLFYDPFDAPEYTHPELAAHSSSYHGATNWTSLPRRRFAHRIPWRAREVKPLTEYPVSWGVMF